MLPWRLASELIAIEGDNHKLERQTLHFCFFETCFLGRLLELLQNAAFRKSEKLTLPKQGLRRNACVFTFQIQALHRHRRRRRMSSSLIDDYWIEVCIVDFSRCCCLCQTLHFCLLDTCFLAKVPVFQNGALRESGKAMASGMFYRVLSSSPSKFRCSVATVA
jgi:hypothetical protein